MPAPTVQGLLPSTGEKEGVEPDQRYLNLLYPHVGHFANFLHPRAMYSH